MRNSFFADFFPNGIKIQRKTKLKGDGEEKKNI